MLDAADLDGSSSYSNEPNQQTHDHSQTAKVVAELPGRACSFNQIGCRSDPDSTGDLWQTVRGRLDQSPGRQLLRASTAGAWLPKELILLARHPRRPARPVMLATPAFDRLLVGDILAVSSWALEAFVVLVLQGLRRLFGVCLIEGRIMQRVCSGLTEGRVRLRTSTWPVGGSGAAWPRGGPCGSPWAMGGSGRQHRRAWSRGGPGGAVWSRGGPSGVAMRPREDHIGNSPSSASPIPPSSRRRTRLRVVRSQQVCL